MKKLLTIAEAAEETGVPYRAIRTCILNGDIRYVKVGRRYYINSESLMKFIEGEK